MDGSTLRSDSTPEHDGSSSGGGIKADSEEKAAKASEGRNVGDNQRDCSMEASITAAAHSNMNAADTV